MAVPTYLELAQMSATPAFADRCAAAVCVFARAILTEAPATQNHNRRYNWAISAVRDPRGQVLALPMAFHAAFANQNPLNLATTPDSGAGSVQTAVEATINATVLTF